MSLKELLEKCKEEKKEQANPSSAGTGFKIKLGGRKSSVPATEGDGEDKTVRDETVNADKVLVGLDQQESESDLAGHVTPNMLDDKSSPSSLMDLEDLNHESQPDGFNDASVRQFKAGIAMLHEHIEDKDLVGDAVNNVLGMLSEHDELRKLLRPEDIGMMVRGLREHYGTVIKKKDARATKRKASNEAVEAIVSEIGDLEINI